MPRPPSFRSRVAPAAALLVSFLTLTAGCGGGGVTSAPTDGVRPSATRSFRSVRLTLTPEDGGAFGGRVTYARGQTAHLVFSVTNESTEAVSFIGAVFPAQLIILKDGAEIWRIEYGEVIIDRGRQPTSLSVSRILTGGQTLEYHLEWPLADSNGRRVAPGDYEAVAWFDAEPGTLANHEDLDPRTALTSGPLPITVR